MTNPAPVNERLDRLIRQQQPRRHGGHRYSSFVRSLRVVLPLSAVALLVLAVVWPQFEFGENLEISGLPTSLDDVSSQEIRMVAARVVGTDEEGRPFKLRAAEAQQVDGLLNRILLQKPEAELTADDGSKIELSADEGEYTRANEHLVFKGNVVLVHSQGYRLETTLARVDIAGARAYGDQPVSGSGPSGELSGSGFEILDKGKTVKVLGRSKFLLNQIPEKAD